MAASVENVAITAFEMAVHESYQSKGNKLKGTFTPAVDIIGNLAYFPTIGAVESQPYVAGAVINNQDPNLARVACTLQRWYASVAIADLDRYVTNVNLIAASSKVVLASMGRKFDQLVIAALNGGFPGNPNTVPVDNDAAHIGQPNLTFEQLLKANLILDANGVPREGRHCALSASGQASLMRLQQFTNVFYAAEKTIPGGTVDYSTSLGITFHMIPDMQGGGLPLAGNTRSSFVWHEEAIGGADAVNLMSQLNYLPDTDSHRMLAKYSLNAVAIDPRGIVRIQTTEA